MGSRELLPRCYDLITNGILNINVLLFALFHPWYRTSRTILFSACKHASELMTKGGCIINVASAISRMAYPSAVVYTATKGAVDVMTRVLATELGPQGIRVNVLAPGSTRTDMNSEKSGKTKEEEKQEIAATRSRRIGEPDDIAAVASLLASDDARWVTGAWIDASGGIRL